MLFSSSFCIEVDSGTDVFLLLRSGVQIPVFGVVFRKTTFNLGSENSNVREACQHVLCHRGSLWITHDFERRAVLKSRPYKSYFMSKRRNFLT